MRLCLQMGYGMMEHTRVLLDEWGSGEAILSPRDLEQQQMARMAEDIRKRGGNPLLDPQCYIRDADHHRLTDHAYWQEFGSNTTFDLVDGEAGKSLLTELQSLVEQFEINTVILPSVLATTANSDWFYFQSSIISESREVFDDRALYSTIALSNEVMKDEDQIEAIVERSSGWDVAGHYVVPETPTSYLVDDPGWLANLLLLCAGLKLQQKSVLVGYSNHQMLCLAAASVDAIASGTWLNVRSFPPSKFYNPPEDSISRRTVWYYCPQALSEYKIPFLDIAKRSGILNELSPPANMPDAYAKPLFSGADPATVNWGETESFRHYLASLRRQVINARKSTYQETVDHQYQVLDAAEKRVEKLRKNGVFGQHREFSEFFDVNRSALVLLDSARGALLSRYWGKL